MKKKKKATEKIQDIRTFVFVHTQGEEKILAENAIAAKAQAREICAGKGLHYQRDRKDFYEVIV